MPILLPHSPEFHSLRRHCVSLGKDDLAFFFGRGGGMLMSALLDSAIIWHICRHADLREEGRHAGMTQADDRGKCFILSYTWMM